MADIFPNISFDESDVGPRPVAPVSFARIGVVGEFTKGPNNQFVLVDTPENLAKIFGTDTKNGSIAIQTAMDQGARDFGVRRVMGQARPATGYLRPVLDGVATASGKVVLMSTGYVVPVLGEGVTSKEDLAQDIVTAVNAFNFGFMRASAAGNVVNLQSSIDGLPLALRLVDRNQPGSVVANSGMKFMLPDGAELLPDSLVRLSGSNLNFAVEYDQSAISSDLTVTLGSSVANGNFVTAKVGLTEATATRQDAQSVTVTPAAIAEGEKVSVTIGGINVQSTLKTSSNTIKNLMDDIRTNFTQKNPVFLAQGNVTLTVANDGVLTVAAVANKSFANISITASVIPATGSPSPTGTATLNNPGVLKPALVTVAALVADLKRQLQEARSDLNFVANAGVLTVSPAPAAPMSADVTLSAKVSANVTATWSNSKLFKPGGAVKPFHLHIMLGAEADVVQGSTTAESLAAALSQSLNSRGLGLTATVRPVLNELVLTSRFLGAEGNASLLNVGLYQSGSLSTIGSLGMKYRSGAPNALLSDLSNGLSVLLQGGEDGPKKGHVVISRRKFVRAQATATLSWASNNVLLTLNSGEVTINGVTKSLAAATCNPAVGDNGSNYVVAEIDASGNLVIKTVNQAVRDQVVIGQYTLTGNAAQNNLGSFSTEVYGKAVNGDVLRIEAASEGIWSNLAKVSVLKDNGLISLTATYNGDVEIFQFDLKTSLDGSKPYRVVIPTSQSNYIKAIYVNPLDDALDDDIHAVSDLPLLGGQDGPPPTFEDYLRVLDAIDSDSVNILIASGNTHPGVRQKLIEKAAASNEINGLRIAVLAADRRLSASQAQLQTANLDSPYAVMVGGWSTYSKRSDLAPLSTPPDGFYAGHIAAMQRFEASPAARTSAAPFTGISAVDIPVTGSQAYNAYTKARLEMIIPDQVSGNFHCLNGRSLSSDPAWNWIALRRVYNFIRGTTFQALQFAKSEPNNSQLRSTVAGTVDQIMYMLKLQGRIDGFQQTKVDSENNTPNMIAQGMLRVDMFFTPVYPADFITVGLHRVVPVSVTVQAGQ